MASSQEEDSRTSLVGNKRASRASSGTDLDTPVSVDSSDEDAPSETSPVSPMSKSKGPSVAHNHSNVTAQASSAASWNPGVNTMLRTSFSKTKKAPKVTVTASKKSQPTEKLHPNSPIPDTTIHTPKAVPAVEEKTTQETEQEDSESIEIEDINRQEIDKAEYAKMDHYYPGLQAKQGVTCFKCMVPGHQSETCPARTCSTCGSKDHHLTANCPTTRLCQRCLKIGHWDDNCEEEEALGQRPACSLCGANHDERRCERTLLTYHHQDKANPEGLVNDNLTISCYNCGSSRHFGPECPTKRRRNPPNLTPFENNSSSIASAANLGNREALPIDLTYQPRDRQLGGRGARGGNRGTRAGRRGNFRPRG